MVDALKCLKVYTVYAYSKIELSRMKIMFRPPSNISKAIQVLDIVPLLLLDEIVNNDQSTNGGGFSSCEVLLSGE